MKAQMVVLGPRWQELVVDGLPEVRVAPARGEQWAEGECCDVLIRRVRYQSKTSGKQVDIYVAYKQK